MSDHGFDKVTHQVNLNRALTDAGFITLSGEGQSATVTSWSAFAWYVGGSAVVVVQDAEDRGIVDHVEGVLRTLANDPAMGIERIYDRIAIADQGMAEAADYVVAFKPGYRMGNSFEGPLVVPSSGGAHGAYSGLTVRPDMRSAFFVSGPGIASGRNLGIIDIRQIAPTLAGIMGAPFPSASATALPIHDQDQGH